MKLEDLNVFHHLKTILAVKAQPLCNMAVRRGASFVSVITTVLNHGLLLSLALVYPKCSETKFGQKSQMKTYSGYKAVRKTKLGV